MKFYLLVIFLAAFNGCWEQNAVSRSQDEHAAASGHTTEESRVGWNNKREAVMYWQPFVAGKASRIRILASVQDTVLRPIDTARVRVSLVVNGKGVRTESRFSAADNAYIAELKPPAGGNGYMVVEIETSVSKTEIRFPGIRIEEKEHAMSETSEMQDAHAGSTAVFFAKKQQWETPFHLLAMEEQALPEQEECWGSMERISSDAFVASASASGYIHFPQGNPVTGVAVRRGTVFCAIGGEGARSDLSGNARKEAELEQASAKKEYDRMRKLSEGKLVLQENMEAAALRLNLANEKLSRLEQGFGIHGKQVRVPGDGVLTELLVEEGSWVDEGASIAKFSKEEHLLLNLLVPVARKYDPQKQGDERFCMVINGETIWSDALSLRFLSETPHPDHPGFFIRKYELAWQEGLLPQAAFSVTRFSGSRKNRLLLPASAIGEFAGEYFVYIQKEGEMFERRVVRVRNYGPDRYEVLEGLKKEDRVVAQGLSALRMTKLAGQPSDHGHSH